MAVESGAEGGESREADSGNVVVFDFGKVNVRYTDLFGKFAEGDFTVDHDAVEIKDDLAGGGIGEIR